MFKMKIEIQLLFAQVRDFILQMKMETKSQMSITLKIKEK